MRVLLIDHTAPLMEVSDYKKTFSKIGEETVELPKHWNGRLPACDAALLLGLSADVQTGIFFVRGIKRRLGDRLLFVVTGHRHDPVIKAVREAGAADVFIRPISRDEVARALQAACTKE